MPERCPKCGSVWPGAVIQDEEKDDVFWNFCWNCSNYWNNRQLIDPAPLLDLIEKTADDIACGRSCSLGIGQSIAYNRLIAAIVKHLKGNTEPLQKLSGELK